MPVKCPRSSRSRCRGWPLLGCSASAERFRFRGEFGVDAEVAGQPIDREARHVASIPLFDVLDGAGEQADLRHRERLHFRHDVAPREFDRPLLEGWDFRRHPAADFGIRGPSGLLLSGAGRKTVAVKWRRLSFVGRPENAYIIQPVAAFCVLSSERRRDEFCERSACIVGSCSFAGDFRTRRSRAYGPERLYRSRRVAESGRKDLCEGRGYVSHGVGRGSNVDCRPPPRMAQGLPDRDQGSLTVIERYFSFHSSTPADQFGCIVTSRRIALVVTGLNSILLKLPFSTPYEPDGSTGFH